MFSPISPYSFLPQLNFIEKEAKNQQDQLGSKRADIKTQIFQPDLLIFLLYFRIYSFSCLSKFWAFVMIPTQILLPSEGHMSIAPYLICA